MKRLTNKTIFSLARKTLHLTDLNLSSCRQLTDEGFKTINSLKALTSIDISDNFLLSNNSIRLLPPNSLMYINASKITKLTDNGVLKFSEKFTRIQRVVLGDVHKLTEKSADYILENCKDIRYIDFNGCFEGEPQLERVLESHPEHRHLSYDRDTVSFKIGSLQRHEKFQMDHHLYNFRLAHSAKVVQLAWRRLKQYRTETVALKKRNRFRARMATKIQSVLRMYFKKLYVQKIREAKVRACKERSDELRRSRYWNFDVRRQYLRS